MALAEDIQQLAEHSKTALDAVHNYYAHTQAIWQLLDTLVADEGREFVARNTATGSVVNEKDLLGLSQHYIGDYLTSATFQQFVSLFEDFFFELLRLWLVAYPHRLSKKQIDFGTVLRAPDKSAITLTVVDKELNELKYKRVIDWFEYLESMVNLGCPSRDEIEKIAELKASRDILAHNKGITNAIYIAKAGNHARYKDGEKLEIPEPYHRESWELVKRVVQDVSAAAINKA